MIIISTQERVSFGSEGVGGVRTHTSQWFSAAVVQCTIRQKQSKDSQNSKNQHWCTNRHMSAEYTKPRKRRYLAKPPLHVPGQWRQPVTRDQG